MQNSNFLIWSVFESKFSTSVKESHVFLYALDNKANATMMVAERFRTIQLIVKFNDTIPIFDNINNPIQGVNPINIYCNNFGNFESIGRFSKYFI